MQKILKGMEGARKIIEDALRNAEQTETVITLGTTKTLKVSREEAEALLEFLQKYCKIKTEKEFKAVVKRDYDEIPYIIGASEETEIGKFQKIIEECMY